MRVIKRSLFNRTLLKVNPLFHKKHGLHTFSKTNGSRMTIFVVDANLDVSAPFKLVTRVRIIVEKSSVERKIGF